MTATPPADNLVPIVFDTNVLIKVYLHRHVLRNRSPYTEIYDAIIGGQIVPIYSRSTMDELLGKLTKPNELTIRFQIDPEEARDFIEGIFYELGDLAIVTNEQGLSSDPKDRMFEEAALAGGSECGRPAFLISDDEDLHEAAVVKQLQDHGVKIIWSHQFTV